MLDMSASSSSSLPRATPISKLDDPYLDLLKKCITRYLFSDDWRPLFWPSPEKHPIRSMFYSTLAWLLDLYGLTLYRYSKWDKADRYDGRVCPQHQLSVYRSYDSMVTCMHQLWMRW